MRVVITERRGGHFEGESSGRGVGEERSGVGEEWERRGEGRGEEEWGGREGE